MRVLKFRLTSHSCERLLVGGTGRVGSNQKPGNGPDMKRKRKARAAEKLEWSPAWMWERFDAERTREQDGDPSLVINNRITLSVKAGCDDHTILLEIAAAAMRPFPVVSLPPFTPERVASPWGKSIFDYVGTAIDQIVGQYPGFRWWISRDGLVVAAVPPVTKPLSEFDRLAGRLMAESCADGKLSAEVLRCIAVALDTADFFLKDHLQPSQWKPIAEFNQKYSKAAVKTFTQAVKRSQFERSIRRRLYVARDRYLAARPEAACPQSS